MTVGAEEHKTDRESMLESVEQNGSEEHKANRELMLKDGGSTINCQNTLFSTRLSPQYRARPTWGPLVLGKG